MVYNVKVILLAIFNLYKRYSTHIHDFLVFLLAYILVYLLDIYIYTEFGLNSKFLSLFAFVVIYQLTRDIIRILRKRQFFGGFVNYGRAYALIMSITSWIAYLLFMRMQKF